MVDPEMIHDELRKRDEQIDMLCKVIGILVDEIDDINKNQHLYKTLAKNLNMKPEMTRKLNLYDERAL